MGTTVAGLVLTASRAIWFNVGDSRVYRDRNGRLEQLSVDDVPPGARSGVITQSLGGGFAFMPISPQSEPRTWRFPRVGCSAATG